MYMFISNKVKMYPTKVIMSWSDGLYKIILKSNYQTNLFLYSKAVCGEAQFHFIILYTQLKDDTFEVGTLCKSSNLL